MKIVAVFATIAALGTAAPALAQYAQYDRVVPQRDYSERMAPGSYQGRVLPPFEVLTIVRSMGLDPISRPSRRGPVYEIVALDDEDVPVHVVVDARSGRVMQVREQGPSYYPGERQGGRYGAYKLPPETIPPGMPYPRRDAGQYPPSPNKLATRTPLPRPAPPESRAAANGPMMADPKAVPGRSVPAPVGGRTATTADSGPATTGTAGGASAKPEPKKLDLVPVAPLE